MKYLKHLQFVFLAALMICGVKTGYAQNVTISPKTGNFIAAVSYGNEGGFALGFSSMWRHNQLPLAFTTSDGTALTSSGLLKLHANNIIEQDDNMAIIATGNGYFTLSMPRGYRFTGYKFVFVDKYAGYSTSKEKFHNWEIDRSTIDWSFSEMDKTLTEIGTSGSATISLRSQRVQLPCKSRIYP
jgi:hypothetical protein